MPGLSRKDTRRVLAAAERQGACLVARKDGVVVRFPDGTSTIVHWTDSDHRSAANMRARFRRSGLAWPFDKTPRKSRGAEG